ncbi:MAG: aldehyde dehydrogenase family protein [Patescibacteria group bacterium]
MKNSHLGKSIEEHCKETAYFIDQNKESIIQTLLQYESRLVAEDEIKRTIDLLNSIYENISFFTDKKVDKIAVFLPLNLPLYSLFLFAAIPSYQSKSTSVRAPQLLHTVFSELVEKLFFAEFYPSVRVTDYNRDLFVEEECKNADVVIFTGKYNNFLRMKECCSKNALFIYNGVGHNPVVVTPNADVALAAQKVAFLKTFNNGQDCAGPDMILVHKDVIENFLANLHVELDKISVGSDYHEGVIVGPMSETASLVSMSEQLSSTKNRGGVIVSGGSINFRTGVAEPTISRYHIKDFCNYKELYCPLILVAEYDSDSDLQNYFEDRENQYIQEQMYVTVFGDSDYIAKEIPGTIVLRNLIIHDVERGTEEYGGYGAGASQINKGGITISKPLLIPREIYNYCLSDFAHYFELPQTKQSSYERIRDIVSEEFTKRVNEIFGSDLAFAYIFGSFARGRDKGFSDIDTFICVNKNVQEQIDVYIQWIFQISELFGKIPDFVYPAEIVNINDLRPALDALSKITLSSSYNPSYTYDAMVWAHSLSNTKIAVINEENIPDEWLDLFPRESVRLLKSFLEESALEKYPEKEQRDAFVKNLLTGKGLVDFLKKVSFAEEYNHIEPVWRAVSQRNFFGKKYTIAKGKEILRDKAFRFGPV